MFNLICGLFLFCSCRSQPVRIGVQKDDIRCLSARLIESNDEAVISEFSGREKLLEAVRSGVVEVAYLEARDALAMTAKGEANLVIIAIATRKEYKPEIVLAARADWLANNKAKSRLLIESHKRATRLIQSQDSAAIRLASKLTGKSERETGQILSGINYESGMDRAALIGLLDDLRRENVITPSQADALALKLIEQEAESSKP